MRVLTRMVMRLIARVPTHHHSSSVGPCNRQHHA